MTNLLYNSPVLLEHKAVNSETYFIVIRSSRKLLDKFKSANLVVLGVKRKSKYWLVEYVSPFRKWTKILKVPEELSIPRVVISQGFMISLARELVKKNWNIYEMEFYEEHLPEVSIIKDEIEFGKDMEVINKIYEDISLFVNVKSIVLIKKTKQVAIDSLFSIIKIFERRDAITEDDYCELVDAINNVLSKRHK